MAPPWAACGDLLGVGAVAGRLVGRLGAFGRPFLAASDRLHGSRGGSLATLLDRPLLALDEDRPEAGRLDLVAERVGVADEDDRHPRRVDPARGRVLHVLGGHGLDRRPVADQLVVGQLVDEQPGQRADDRARASRTGAGRRRSGSRARPRSSAGGDRRVADPVELGHEVGDGGHRDLGVHRGAGAERPGRRGGGRSPRRRRRCSPSPRAASC